MGDALEMGIPEAHRDAAEEVRAHLVAVRGGAPFLSSADARRLAGWLDDGIPVSTLLRAIEAAAAARRAARSRLPLTLGAAGRFLPKLAAKPPATSGGFAAIAAELRAKGADRLADALLAVDGEPEERVRAASRLARDHLQAVWDALPDRSKRLEAAAAELADLGLDEQALQAASEELARDGIRRHWPMLDAAALWDAAHGAPA
jgi:hypothetical protein